VSARELSTGKEASIQVKPSYGLTDEEVERMLLDSFAHAETDLSQRTLVEQRVEADRILNATRAALQQSPELATEEDQANIAAALLSLELARSGSDAAAIRRGVEALDASSKAFAQRRMDRALERGFAGRGLTEVEAELNAPGRR
jgi:molecular chaperone HscA